MDCNKFIDKQITINKSTIIEQIKWKLQIIIPVEQQSQNSFTLYIDSHNLMKTAKTLSYHQITSSQQTHQIKCYLKLYNSNGLSSPQAHPPSNYQILDQNTLLRKTMSQNKQQYQMYPYTRIFSARIGNQLMSKHVCFADDLQEGINHTTIAIVDQSTKRLFSTVQVLFHSDIGSIQQHGVFLQYFLTLFQDFQNRYYQNKTSQVYLTMFATVNCKANQYIDLINGQRYTYLSKKDVDTASYKTFHQLKVQSIQEFLIGLKIATVRYQECCNDDDFIVFRLTTLNEDEFCQKKTVATGNVVVCHQDNKNTQTFLKQVQTLVNYSSPSGQPYQVKDHGSLFSCIEPYLRNGKISMIQCILNQYQHIEANLPQIKRIPSLFMNKTCAYKVNKQQVPLEKFLLNHKQKISSQTNIHKNDLSTVTNLTTKQLQKFTQIFTLYKQFIKESTDKLSQFCKLYKHLIETRNQFYEKERFPVSLQIKQFQDVNFIIKSYYISKIYSLSEKFQMPSLENPSQKMTTIKHQIFLSLKSLVSMLSRKNTKKQTQIGENDQNNQSSGSLNNASSFSLNKSYDFVTSPSKKARSDSIQNSNQKSSQKYEKLTKVMRAQLETIKKNVKYILNIDSKTLMQEVNETDHNDKEINYKKKLKKLKEQKQMKFILDNLDLGQLFGQHLIVQLEKLMKNLLSKRQLSNGQRNNKRESVDFLVGPNQNRQLDCIKDSGQNSLRLSKKNSLTKQSDKLRISHEADSSIQQQNSRIIIFRQHKAKNISQYDPQYSQKNTKRKMKKLNSEPQTLEESLMQVKRQLLSKHLQIRQNIQNFQNQSKLINRTKVALTQNENSICNKGTEEGEIKSRIQSQKQNLNTHITEVQQEQKKFKSNPKENKQKYQLVHQKAIKKAEESQMTKPLLNLQISQIFPQNHHVNEKSMSKQIKKKQKTQKEDKQNSILHNQQHSSLISSNYQPKLLKKGHQNSSLLQINKPQKISVTIGLPQIKRSLEKSLDIDHNHRQTIIHSPKHKRKHLVRVVNNSIIDEPYSEARHKKRFDSKGNKKFLPEISLMGKKISG